MTLSLRTRLTFSYIFLALLCVLLVSARVFERFYRADDSRSRSSGGVGIELSITKAIMEAHGGTIRAVSGPGSGSVLLITLPPRSSDW